MLDEPHHGKSDSAMDIYSTKLYTFGFIAELLKALPEGNVRQVVTDTVSLQVSPMDGWAYFRILKELNLVEKRPVVGLDECPLLNEEYSWCFALSELFFVILVLGSLYLGRVVERCNWLKRCKKEVGDEDVKIGEHSSKITRLINSPQRR